MHVIAGVGQVSWCYACMGCTCTNSQTLRHFPAVWAWPLTFWTHNHSQIKLAQAHFAYQIWSCTVSLTCGAKRPSCEVIVRRLASLCLRFARWALLMNEYSCGYRCSVPCGASRDQSTSRFADGRVGDGVGLLTWPRSPSHWETTHYHGFVQSFGFQFIHVCLTLQCDKAG